MSAPPKISCSIGEAMPITPMPAETFRHKTAQISQNCFVRCAWLKCTVLVEIIFFAVLGVQPCGRQPAGGRR